jgi:dTDP-3-amino-2,3,6-trideoxy-4-keto-D-glucose/dTDP-3-amino-3,4,6-trideoxy-alpha-D-glucose/dTDP-2,6-dideoxy-D-kanosamine transaminase
VSVTIAMFSPSQMHAEVDLERAIMGVVASGHYILGPEVQAFEQRFADYCAVSHCVGVANGTDALELSLRVLGVLPGDRVAIVANAGGYSSTAVRAVGATPVWVDVDPQGMTMAPAQLASVLAGGIAAVIVTHLYGQLADIEGLLSVARTAGVPVIEDCAQSHGARRHGRMAGSFGELGCFSFYPTKNLGALGDGGAIVTSDEGLATRLRSLRQYGWSRKYHTDAAGGRNSRLDEIQAAVLLTKLPRLDDWNSERREIARRYSDGLSDLPVELPVSLDEDYVAHLYVIRVEERDRLLSHLMGSGIGADIHYPVADHRQPIHAASLAPPSLPVTEEACARVLTLPCYPGLRSPQQDTVIDTVRSFFSSDGS